MSGKYFIMAPEGLEYQRCLHRWLSRPGINPHAICYAVIRMIGRLARNRQRSYPVSEIIYGLNNKNVPYKVLKEIATESALFECGNGYLRINYEKLPYFLHHDEDAEHTVDCDCMRYFIMVPEGLETDPRIQPWLQHDHVSPEALCYIIVCMMGRLYNCVHPVMAVSDLIKGFNSKNISCKFLESLVRESGFFEVYDDYVMYNWEKFCDNPAQKSAQNRISERPQSQAEIPQKSLTTPPSLHASSPEAPPTTYAREDLNKNKKNNNKMRQEQQSSRVEGGTDNLSIGENFVSLPVQQSAPIPPETPVSAPSAGRQDDGTEAHIHKIMNEISRFIEPESLKGWYGRTVQDRLKVVERRFIHMLSLQDTKLAAAVGRNLGLENWREQWRDIIEAYVGELYLMGYLPKIDRPGKEYTYLLALSSPHQKSWQYSRESMLRHMRCWQENRAKLQPQPAHYTLRPPISRSTGPIHPQGNADSP